MVFLPNDSAMLNPFLPNVPFCFPLENLWFSGDQNEKLGRKLQREKCPNTEFFSGPYFPVFRPNTGKYGPEKLPYLDTFHEVNG